MLPRVSLVNGGIFGFVEMWGFSPLGLYCHETVQPVLCSVSRCPANCMRIIKRYFAVLRLLQNLPAKSQCFLPILVVPKMRTATLTT